MQYGKTRNEKNPKICNIFWNWREIYLSLPGSLFLPPTACCWACCPSAPFSNIAVDWIRFKIQYMTLSTNPWDSLQCCNQFCRWDGNLHKPHHRSKHQQSFSCKGSKRFYSGTWSSFWSLRYTSQNKRTRTSTSQPCSQLRKNKMPHISLSETVLHLLGKAQCCRWRCLEEPGALSLCTSHPRWWLPRVYPCNMEIWKWPPRVLFLEIPSYI